MIIRGVYDTVGAPEGQPSPLTSSDIKQMLAVTSEAGWSSSLAPAIRSYAGGTDAGMEREEEAEGGVGAGGAHGGPLCPQLSEPANDSSQGGCCKRAGKLKQTPRLGAATCVAACCHSKH